MAGKAPILLTFVLPELTKYLKINMHPVNTCSKNAATEISRQKSVPDPLTRENCLLHGCTYAWAAARDQGKAGLVILTHRAYNYATFYS